MSVSKQRRQTRILVHSAMWVALSMVLIMLVQIPLFAAAPWMKYDIADVPVMIPFNAIKAGLNAVISFVVYQLLIKRSAFFDFTREQIQK